MGEENVGDQVYIPGYGWVARALRQWWANAADRPDEEIIAIDGLEDGLRPLGDDTAHVRRLIGCLESCHHKLERHVDVIVEAIGSGRTDKGQGRRDPGRVEPRELEYHALIEALSSWREGAAAGPAVRIGHYKATELVALLGDRTPIKLWQVRMLIEKIGRFLDPERRWRDAHADLIDTEHAAPQAEFRDRTKETIIHDTVDGQPAEITLAAAIDNITGCSWDFVETVRTILSAIGGQLSPSRPLALHARNIKLNPARESMRVVCDTLAAFCEGSSAGVQVDEGILRELGEKTPVKHWLAASLEKTLRLQMGL